jgi:hypothetical protein
MPTFSSAQVTDPFPNILYNPAAVDAAIAKTQSELGNLDINRQELALKQNKFAQGLALGDEFAKSVAGDGTTGTTGAGVGGTYAPGTLPETPQLATVTAPGGAKFQVAATAAERFQGLVTDLEAEGYKLDPATSGGYNKRFIAGTQTPSHHAYGTAVDVNWSRNPQGGTSSDIPVDLARRLAAKHGLVWGGDWSGKTRDPMHFEVPRGARASPPPVVAAPVIPAPAANPNAGPRVGAAPTVPSVAPATTPVADPNARVEADDPNTAAVKQASAALLNMPEADAAAAYPTVVRELQARGFAMQAPPTYPGHAALQALVGGGEPAAAQTKTAMRLGGTDVADASGVVVPTAAPAAPRPNVILDESGKPLLAPAPAPNRMMAGTGLPGVTIGLPQNGMAPPPTAAAPVVTAAAPAQAQPQAANPQPTQPPPAPSRVIQREPLIQSGMARGLTRDQALNAARLFKSGADPAGVLQHIDQLRHQNDVIRQGDATQAAIDEKENYARRHTSEQEAQAAADKKEAQRVAAEHLRLSQEDTAIKQAAEKRAADEAAAKAADPLQGKSEDERIERTLLQIAPKLRPGYSGPPPTDAEKDQYNLLWNKYRAGPIQEIPDGKGGFFKANVPRDVPPEFPPPPGQKVSPGPQAIPGTERQPEMAPATVVGGMLANGIGQRKIMTALAGLEAHPDAVGLKANAPNWLLQRTDPEGESLRAAVSNVGGHEFHELSGAAVQMSEAKRLKYIPSDTDSATTLKTKLHQMLDDNRAALLQSYRTYGPEGNFRRSVAIEEAIIDSIPQVSIDSLKAKPETARDFDKAFGKGAAKLVLQHD